MVKMTATNPKIIESLRNTVRQTGHLPPVAILHHALSISADINMAISQKLTEIYYQKVSWGKYVKYLLANKVDVLQLSSKTKKQQQQKEIDICVSAAENSFY